jgi:hypothetical protein
MVLDIPKEVEGMVKVEEEEKEADEVIHLLVISIIFLM